MTKLMRGLAVLMLVMTTVLIAAPENVSIAGDEQAAPTLELLAEGFDRPVNIVSAGDGTNRLFIIEQKGTVWIVANGVRQPEPFLYITPLVQIDPFFIEQGMLGLAFHPDYETNGFLYVSYVAKDDSYILERFQVTEDPDRVLPSSAVRLLRIPQSFRLHYSGMLAFGPDGYLYAGVGDATMFSNPQFIGNLNGSILRLDVDNGDPYTIPADNPFIDDPDARPEIWSYGLRNPWRFSFDALTGDFYIGDVGENAWEEVNVQSAGSAGGENYGWPVVEGNHCNPDYDSPVFCDPSDYTPPAFEYTRDSGCAVVGGYVYRGDIASELYDHYLFSDYCQGTLWSIQQGDNDDWELTSETSTGLMVSSFGQDEFNNLYLAAILDGDIYRIVMPGETIRPAISWLEPAQLFAGGVACQVAIRGSGFMENSIVTWNGEPRQASFVDSTRLQVGISSADLAQPGSIMLTVTNPSNGKQSDPVGYDIVSNGLAGGAIWSAWSAEDGPVAAGAIERSWLWGASGLSCPVSEPYLDAPGETRLVQYFDKARMEITDPAGDPAAPWFVTNGRLVAELVTGQVQLGDDTYEHREPAVVNVAGDPNDPAGPTYLSFSDLLRAEPLPAGTLIQQRIDRAGLITEEPAMADYEVTGAQFVPETGHTIAEPFWEFMQSLDQADGNPYYATGLPITEAYWTEVLVGGEQNTVLVQLFERRALTYTPENPLGWQVEAGNVGQHYLAWRYGDES